MEHRWGERRPIDLAVRFVVLPGTVGTGHVINISSSGAFMETQIPLRLLSLLYLQPMNFAEDEIAATVVRRDARGVGLEWCEFKAETMKSYLLMSTPRALEMPSRRPAKCA
jgi:PilZ domain